MTTVDIKLDPMRRGTEFRYSSTLTEGWQASMFTGGIVLTLRKEIPASKFRNDFDAGVVDQVSVTSGGIVFSSETEFEVIIPGSRTTKWPTQVLVWDMQGIITASPDNRILDIAAGTVLVKGDVTRSQ